METIHPTVLHGCTTWDRAQLPIDEFEQRVKAIRENMIEQDINGLIVYGDNRDYAPLCYFTNYIPMLGWAMVLIPLEGDPYLLVNAAGTRDIPFVNQLTWIENINHAKDFKLVSKKFKTQIYSYSQGRLQLGVIGGEQMRLNLYNQIISEYQGFSIKAFDSYTNELMEVKRPREISIINIATNIIEQAVESIFDKYYNNGDISQAVIEGERMSRYLGAHDARLLVSPDGGQTFLPYSDISNITDKSIVIYLAIQYLGYWTEKMIMLGGRQRYIEDKANQLIHFLQTTMNPGKTIGEVVEETNKVIAPFELHSLVKGSFGHSIGLSLDEKPRIHQDDKHMIIKSGHIYSLNIGLIDPLLEQQTFQSCIIEIRDNENKLY